MGFYKRDGDSLMCAPQAVYAPEFALLAEQHAEYSYPVDGWYWFDSDAEAVAVLGGQVQ